VQVFSGRSTQPVALSTPEFVILAFRGTRIGHIPDPVATLVGLLHQPGGLPDRGELVAPNWDDVLTDANFPTGPGGAHQGFEDALAQLDETAGPPWTASAGI
jgi:hypothetical protein